MSAEVPTTYEVVANTRRGFRGWFSADGDPTAAAASIAQAST